VQIPTWDGRFFDLKKAAESKAYCDELKGTAARHGIEITELATHLQGQLVAVNPAYDDALDAFAALRSAIELGYRDFGYLTQDHDLDSLRGDPRFIELAGHINAGMPHYVVEKVGEALNTRRKAVNGSSILIFGVAYKRDIDDMRESPALDVIELLAKRGAVISYSDPWVPELRTDGRHLKSVDLGSAVAGRPDCVVICTDHSSFKYDEVVKSGVVIVDTRNALKDRKSPGIFRL
jgi:hypothetical protein